MVKYLQGKHEDRPAFGSPAPAQKPGHGGRGAWLASQPQPKLNSQVRDTLSQKAGGGGVGEMAQWLRVLVISRVHCLLFNSLIAFVIVEF